MLQRDFGIRVPTALADADLSRECSTWNTSFPTRAPLLLNTRLRLSTLSQNPLDALRAWQDCFTWNIQARPADQAPNCSTWNILQPNAGPGDGDYLFRPAGRGRRARHRTVPRGTIVWLEPVSCESTCLGRLALRILEPCPGK